MAAAKRVTAPVVWITRAARPAAKLAEQLRAVGAEPYCQPLFAIRPLDSGRRQALLQHCLRHLHAVDWAVFVSTNAVEGFARGLQAIGLQPPSTLSMAAVGPKTARAARAEGLPVHLMPQRDFSSEGLLAAWDENTALKGRRMRIFRAQSGRGWLARQLQARGAQVRHITCYLRLPQPPEALPMAHPGGEAVVLISSLGSLRVLQAAAKRPPLTAFLRAAGALAYSPRLMQQCRASRLFAWSEAACEPTDQAVCAWFAERRAGFDPRCNTAV